MKNKNITCLKFYYKKALVHKTLERISISDFYEI
nr:MAG TPA_asm: hypothetical protein [Caudoviricetes sp.]